MDNRKVFHMGKLFFSVVLIVGLAFFVAQKGHVLLKIKSIDPQIIFGMLACHFVNFCLLGIVLQRTLNNKEFKRLPFREWFGLTMTSNLFNLFLPAKGGTALKWHYLKKTYSLSVREFLYLNGRAVLWGFVVVSLVGVGICILSSTPLFQQLTSVSVLVSALCFGAYFGLPRLRKRIFKKSKPKFTPRFSRKDLLIISIAFIGVFILYPIKIYLGLSALGYSLPVKNLLEVGLIVLFASSFPILPGNIGIKELVTATMSSRYGIPMEYALAAGLIDRACLYMFLIPGGLYFSYRLHIQEDIDSPEVEEIAHELQQST